jgi:hypothetical protein
MTARITNSQSIPGLPVALGSATVALGATARIALARVALAWAPAVRASLSALFQAALPARLESKRSVMPALSPISSAARVSDPCGYSSSVSGPRSRSRTSARGVTPVAQRKSPSPADYLYPFPRPRHQPAQSSGAAAEVSPARKPWDRVTKNPQRRRRDTSQTSPRSRTTT